MKFNNRIVSFKSVVPFEDLPLPADPKQEWNLSQAIQRVKTFTKSYDKPSKTYRRAFMWFDETAPDNFASYKFPYADVIKGKLYAIPEALNSIKMVFSSNLISSGVSEIDKLIILNYIDRYQAKMDAKYVKPIDPNVELIYG